MNRLVLLFLVLFSIPAQSFIPKFSIVISRTASNHGNGLYQIDQDVVFLHEQEPKIVHEKWIIEGEDKMRLTVTGKRQLKDKIRLTYVYNVNERFFINKDGTKKVNRSSKDWFEKYFHFRYSKKIKPLLVANKIVPAEALKREKRINKLEDIKHEAEPFMRLARVGGVITYGMGVPTPQDNTEKLPGLWIEQDRFVIRKLRLPSQLEVTAERYNKYERNLYMPRLRNVTWPRGQARINVTKVRTMRKTRKNKQLLNHNGLDFSKDPELSQILPEDSVVREFYSRFR